jgi:hypothetical protein
MEKQNGYRVTQRKRYHESEWSNQKGTEKKDYDVSVPPGGQDMEFRGASNVVD